MRLLRDVRNLLGNYLLKSGIYHYYRGEYKRAVGYLGRMLEPQEGADGVDTQMARYYLTQTCIASAEQHEEAGRPEAAVREYRQALVHSPGYADLHHRIGRLLQQMGRPSEAADSYRAALAINGDFLDARLSLAFALLGMGNSAEALKEFQGTRDLAQRAVEEPFVRGREALIAGQHEEAEECMREAFLRRPHQFTHFFRLGLQALQRERYEEAVEALRSACDSQCGFPDAHNTFGVALAESGQPAAAVAQFRRALRCNPDYVVARLNLAHTLLGLGHALEAEQEVRAVLRAEPQNAAGRALLQALEGRRRLVAGR
jgi:tetratricopeptide (TPR) repeat protein